MTSRGLLTSTTVALLSLLASDAVPSLCAASCGAQGKANGWPRAEVGACTKTCKQEQRQCRGTRGSKRADCRRESATCARHCGSVWGQRQQRGDREYCQFVCGSCGKAEFGFCVAGQLSGSPIAQCCGKPGGGPCCTWLGSPDIADCCSTGTTCCSATGCTDTDTDSQNCGGCGVRCGDDGRCVEGACVRDPGPPPPPPAHPCYAEGGEGWTTHETVVAGAFTSTKTYTCSPLVCETSDTGVPDCFRNCAVTQERSDAETHTTPFRGFPFTQAPIALPRCTDQGGIAWLSDSFLYPGASVETTITLMATRCAKTALHTYTASDFICCSTSAGFVPVRTIDGCPS